MDNPNAIEIREATDADLDDVLAVERLAFGEDDEADLVAELMTDLTAKPTVSLLAWRDAKAVGHILFTRASLNGSPVDVQSSILAPLAVVPEAQRQGVGKRLIRAGLDRLGAMAVDLVFVLGNPGYYTRHGFEAAIPHDLIPPHPPPADYPDAWMVQALGERRLGEVTGQVQVAETLARPEYW